MPAFLGADPTMAYVCPPRSYSALHLLNTAEVSKAARAETRNREVTLPPLTVYRWWARRTESINGAILDAFATGKSESLLVADPFAGGGVIPLAAVIRGHKVYAQDIDPWAATGLAAMMNLADAGAMEAAATKLAELAKNELANAYGTTFSDGRPAEISHTIRVASAQCPSCRRRLRLFPHALVSLEKRRERALSDAFLACPRGHLFRGSETGGVTSCPECEAAVDPAADYASRRLVKCGYCETETRIEALTDAKSWRWQVALVERSCGRERELDFPTARETKQAADDQWPTGVDLGVIPVGLETKVLTRHGFGTWNDIYPARQRHVTAFLLAAIDEVSDEQPVRDSLRMALVGTTEMAGLLSRWDRYYLKSYESMAGHRFNFTLLPTEPNVWGATASGRGSATRRLRAFGKGSRWMHAKNPAPLLVEGPLPSASTVIPRSELPDVLIVQGSSERMILEDDSVDLILTDPPYHDDVQYSELSQPLRAWAGLSLENAVGGAHANTATGTNTNGDDYQQILTFIFAECRRVLRPEGHLIFSYANRTPDAWRDLFLALRDAGFAAAGWTILHSENEGDVAKRGVRACNLDFLMDLVPAGLTVHEVDGPSLSEDSDEWRYLETISTFFSALDTMTRADAERLMRELAASPFLSNGVVQTTARSNDVS